MPVETIKWDSGRLAIVDQTLLPAQFLTVSLPTLKHVWNAIKTLQIRGAPAIGICAAYGIVVGLRDRDLPDDYVGLVAAVNESADYLAGARPTAVNLFWALDRMRDAAESAPSEVTKSEMLLLLEAEAGCILEEDRRVCRAIGANGAGLISDGDGVLTHCNAGGLATADYGTAMALMFRAHEEGRAFRVFVGETRPLLQGSRLTAWELLQEGIETTLICDSMAARVMSEGKIQSVIVGADRIAANGDTANKIGTYGLAVLAHAHSIPFYVAAPTSTLDPSLPHGDAIPIEQRRHEEVTAGFGKRTAPEGVGVYNPAFDVTPAGLITAVITEKGITRSPDSAKIAEILSSPSLAAEPGKDTDV